MNNMKLLLQH